MRAENQFSAYTATMTSNAAKAYLNSRIFPALNELQSRGRRARITHYILTALTALAALLLPILLLLPYALPQEIVHLVACLLSVCMVCMLVMDLMLRLPTHAAECRLKHKLLTALVHAYFLCADEFAGLEEEQRLLRLCARTEQILA